MRGAKYGGAEPPCPLQLHPLPAPLWVHHPQSALALLFQMYRKFPWVDMMNGIPGLGLQLRSPALRGSRGWGGGGAVRSPTLVTGLQPGAVLGPP